MSPVQYTIAREPMLAQDVARLWYRAYVNERQDAHPHANHETRLLDEPLVEHGTLFVARTPRGDALGTVLTVHADATDLGFLPGYYNFEPGQPGTSITTKLVIAPEARRSRLSTALACAAYQHALSSGIQYDHIDCQLEHVRLFNKLGYREIGRKPHPYFGASVQLRIEVHNVDHLSNVGSPFQKLLQAHQPQSPCLEKVI